MGRRHDIAAPPPLDRDAEYEIERNSNSVRWRKPRRKITITNFKTQPSMPEKKPKPVPTPKRKPLDYVDDNTPFRDVDEYRKFKSRLAGAMGCWLRGGSIPGGYSASRIAEIVGMGRKRFRKHLQSGGLKYGVDNATIDHIIPQRVGNTRNEIFVLNHYSNMQLLVYEDNIEKSGRLPEDDELHPDSTEHMLRLLNRERNKSYETPFNFVKGESTLIGFGGVFTQKP